MYSKYASYLKTIFALLLQISQRLGAISEKDTCSSQNLLGNNKKN